MTTTGKFTCSKRTDLNSMTGASNQHKSKGPYSCPGSLQGYLRPYYYFTAIQLLSLPNSAIFTSLPVLILGALPNELPLQQSVSELAPRETHQVVFSKIKQVITTPPPRFQQVCHSYYSLCAEQHRFSFIKEGIVITRFIYSYIQGNTDASFFNIYFIFREVSGFTAKLNRRYRCFPYPLLPTPIIISMPHQSGAFPIVW